MSNTPYPSLSNESGRVVFKGEELDGEQGINKLILMYYTLLFMNNNDYNWLGIIIILSYEEHSGRIVEGFVFYNKSW